MPVSVEVASAATDALRIQHNPPRVRRKPLPAQRLNDCNNDASGEDVVQSTCIDEEVASKPTTPPSDITGAPPQPPALAPLLVQTASAARWRRRESGANNSGRISTSQRNQKVNQYRARANSELVLHVQKMEEVHGVDVSWLHHPNREHHKHKHTQSTPDVRRDIRPAATHSTPTNGDVQQRANGQVDPNSKKLPSPPNVTPPKPVQPAKDNTNAVPSTPTPVSGNKAQPRRPSLLQRSSQERMSADSKPGSKRASWMNSLSSKFSSERPGPTPTQQSRTLSNGLPSPQPPSVAGSEAAEEPEPYTPARPKESSSSFFSNLTRRLSSTSQTGGIPKVQATGGLCQRRVLNLDPNRQRCLVPEMDPNKLRRVSFCVDVEIAGGPRYQDDDEDDEARDQRKKQFKMKERAEGEALKRPDAIAEEKDEDGEPKLESKSKARPIPGKSQTGNDEADNAPAATPQTEEERDNAARKREKKQKSEAERKERKEKRRKRAEENGQIPVELSLDCEGGDEMSRPQDQQNGVPGTSLPDTTQQPRPNGTKQDRPTTDPARIYRRCCQLRESPILKRITEQLSRPNATLPQEPGVVQCLDLTGSRLQLADVISLGDWLAVVPVKHLKLEDADLNDEGVRCILAGLLAAKRPEPTKRCSVKPMHREGIKRTPHQERAGVVEKITLKNNPRLTRTGWKHISLFLYMCRSLRTIDLSMNQFPTTLPPSTQLTPIKTGSSGNSSQGGQDLDAAEALHKCLCERIGGNKLEELIMSECGLSTDQIRKVVDGAIVAGVSRLGLAGNHIDEEGLQHVLRYLKSGNCQALDIGGNDLRGKLDLIADAMNTDMHHPCWGLSLADCNLDSASLKPLFATVVNLPEFRFIDLSHNRDLCADNGLISLLRRYIGQLKDLKRIHLSDVGMTPKQAIALADVLPESPRLAHISLLHNSALTALANAKTEDEQEEACALYASLMASVRVSSTIICVDIDVPAADNSEIVKALAKQIVAYSLRNMERFAIADLTGDKTSTENAAAALTKAHGGEGAVKEVSVPDVLFHLVGHVDGNHENHDNDPPAPDEDYIIGGAGVVKALQYVLGEKENEGRRTSYPNTPSGTATPRDRPGSSAGLVDLNKAKKMSKDLLTSARKIRARLQPALAKEALTGDDMGYRRLLNLDETVQRMIERFEAEYPETRLAPSAATHDASETSSVIDQSNLLASSVNTQATDLTAVSDDEEDEIRPEIKRHNSDVSLASRALGFEEGRLHRLGQHMRREVIDSPHSADGGADWAPWRKEEQAKVEEERIEKMRRQIEGTSGVELREIVDREGGWEGVLRKLGGTYEDLRVISEQDPEGWKAFKDAQEKARLNMENP